MSCSSRCSTTHASRRPWQAPLLLGAVLLAAGGCLEPGGEPPARAGGRAVDADRLVVGGVAIEVEIAADPASRERGLMFRERLDRDAGMLFIYPEPGWRHFWMRNTRIPLAIAFFDDSGRIINIEEMHPGVESPTYDSRERCRFALEMNAGWFARHGVEAGDTIQIPPWIRAAAARAGEER
ncbi:MAG: DUF192 domain-containing protein [Planctomycetota bacterium]